MADRKKAIVLGDTHSVFADSSAVDAAIRVIQKVKPEVLIHIGDLVDAYNLSRFEKDIYRLENLQTEIDSCKSLLRKLQKASPKSQKYLLEGNHEDRLQKVVFSSTGQIQELLKSSFLQQNLNWKELLKLDTFDFRLVPSSKQTYGYILPNLLVKHGTIVRKYAGYTARAEFEHSGVSGMSGHTHRLSLYSHTNVHGRHFWMETGCLCDVQNVHYIDGVPNWQQGLGVLTFIGKEWIPEIVPIVDGTAYFRGNAL